MTQYNKMFRFVKQIFVSAIIFFGQNLSRVSSLECISINNQECKVRQEIVNVNSKEPIFYPYSISTSKCSGSCNNINDPYAKLCVPDTIKNLNVKVFNLILRTNKTRHIEWHKTCKCKCRLDPSVCNNKQRLNKDKCRCECKKLIDKGLCDLFGILEIVNGNVINLVLMSSTQTMKIVSVGKNQLIGQLKNVPKMLKKKK